MRYLGGPGRRIYSRRGTREMTATAKRSTIDSDRLTDGSLTSQLRLTQEVDRRCDLKLDYRRLFWFCNDGSRDRNGHRLAVTVRAEF